MSVTSLGPYVDRLREMILRVKYHHDLPVAHGLADLMCLEEAARLQSKQVDLIVPIPHHWSDRLLMRIDPPQLIASRLGGFLKVPVERHILRKRQRTRKQQSLSSVTDRRQNLRDAFSIVRGTDLSGLRIALVDDVLTTGTTCHRASNELKKAGAARIDVVVIARNTGVGSHPTSTSKIEVTRN